jgi:hypothetical protein
MLMLQAFNKTGKIKKKKIACCLHNPEPGSLAIILGIDFYLYYI